MNVANYEVADDNIQDSALTYLWDEGKSKSLTSP